jgi:hypothetical protein
LDGRRPNARDAAHAAPCSCRQWRSTECGSLRAPPDRGCRDGGIRVHRVLASAGGRSTARTPRLRGQNGRCLRVRAATHLPASHRTNDADDTADNPHSLRLSQPSIHPTTRRAPRTARCRMGRFVGVCGGSRRARGLRQGRVLRLATRRPGPSRMHDRDRRCERQRAQSRENRVQEHLNCDPKHSRDATPRRLGTAWEVAAVQRVPRATGRPPGAANSGAFGVRTGRPAPRRD